jgi:3-hydroxyisobutyrate dehydrogenase
MSKQRVALIGLGIMGSGMAGRLLSAGFPLVIYNRNRDKASPFRGAGAVLATSPREAASRAEIVISMVADDVASRAVWLGESGALAGVAPGTVLVESSTLSVAWVRELAEAVSQKRCELLDAPVTGSKQQAANGDLLFLVGGSEAALATARPVLASLSRDAIYLGPTGSGALMKLINNFLCGVQAASLAEAAALAGRAGLDREKAFGILANGAPGSPLVKTLVARVAAGDFTPNFVLRLMAKDLSYAIEEGTRNHVNLQAAAPALAEFQRAIAAGYGESDFSAVLEAIRLSK